MLVMAHQPEIQVGHGEVRSPREYSLVGCGGLGQLAVVAQFAPELEMRINCGSFSGLAACVARAIAREQMMIPRAAILRREGISNPGFGSGDAHLSIGPENRIGPDYEH